MKLFLKFEIMLGSRKLFLELFIEFLELVLESSEL